MSVQALCMVMSESEDHIRFVVDDVSPNTKPLPTVETTEVWTNRLGGAPLAWQGDDEVLKGSGHGLLQAVHIAYATHRPLILDPDSLWITIAQGVARHISCHAEQLRDAVGVSFNGRKALAVEVVHIPENVSQWAKVINAFGERLQNQHSEIVGLMVPQFSTTKPLARTVGQITVMYGFRRYYDYLMVAICGIPEVELRGTLSDWELVRHRLDALAPVAPTSWLSNVKRIADALLQTRRGEPDVAFWQRIYKEREIYGGSEFTGWVGELFPYLGDEGARRNHRTWHTIGDLPSGVVGAEVLIEKRAFPLVAGVVGAKEERNGIRPALGWAVGAPTAISEALDALSEFRADVGVVEHQCFQYVNGSSALSEIGGRAPGLVLTAPTGEVRFLAPSSRTSCSVLELPDRNDEIQFGEQGVIAATYPGGILLEVNVREELGESGFAVFAASEDGTFRLAAGSWLAFLREIRNGGRPLSFLENDPITDRKMGTHDLGRPLQKMRWNGQPKEWRIHRWTTTTSIRFHVHFSKIKARQVALLRAFDPALRQMSARDALSHLRGRNNWVLKADDQTDKLLPEKLDKAGLEFEVLTDTAKHIAIVHVLTGERVYHWPSTILPHMIKSGVLAVNFPPPDAQ